ncbi:hypothetical protein V8G54_013036, partial [Vigna mungo]
FIFVDVAHKVFDDMPVQDVGSWNAKILDFCQNGKATRALGVLGKMKVKGVKMDTITVANVLVVCSTPAAPYWRNKTLNWKTYSVRLSLSLKSHTESSNSTMFGSARIFSDVALRLRQNLSFRGVRVQNINIGGGMGGEIPDNKRLEYALQHLHGIGRSKAHHIVCELGVENKFVKDLSKRELYSIRELLSKYLIGNDLKKCVERDVVRLVGIQCYRGIRHVDNLPCRGQRTHTNARTRRSRKTFSGSR